MKKQKLIKQKIKTRAKKIFKFNLNFETHTKKKQACHEKWYDKERNDMKGIF